MQSGTGECFDLVWMSVCVWVLWDCDMVISFDFIYSCGLQVRRKHSPRSLRATGLCEVSWTAAAPRLRVHVRNDHWHCRAEGVSHTHRYTHTWCQRSSHRCRLRAKWALHPKNCSFYLALLLSFLLSLLHTCCSLLVGGKKLLLRLLFCSLFCSEFHFEWRRRFQGNFCFFF